MAYPWFAGGNVASKVSDLWVIAGPSFGLDWMCVAPGMGNPGGFFFCLERPHEGRSRIA